MGNRAVLTIGAALCALSLVFLIPTALMANQGVEDLEGLEFDTSVYYFDSIISKNNTNEFTFEYIDEDGEGSLPWILMVLGDYSDEDGDGFLDACQDLVLVVHNEEGQNLSESDVGEIYCSSDKNLSLEEVDAGDGLVDIGHICHTFRDDPQNCQVGMRYTITLFNGSGNQVPFTLYDSNASTIAFIGSLAGELSSLSIAGLSGLLSCCGFLVGTIVFIFGLFIGTPLPEESVFVYEPPNSNLEDHARESARPESKSTGSSDMGEWWDDSENID